MEKNKVMREIKFRAKDTLEKNWYVGSYIFTDDNTNNPFRSRPFKESHRIIFYSRYDWNMGGWNDVEIDPSTLGQYTGLKDKNGKEIYEGDIIGCDNPNIKHLIFFNEKQGRFMAALDGDIENYCYGVCGLDDSRWNATKEVIGNIHDNPELINKEK